MTTARNGTIAPPARAQRPVLPATHTAQCRENTAWRVEFHLYGVIAKDQDAPFKQLLEHHQNRIRDQIGFIIRAADLAELADPALGLLKRKILTKVNETLGKPMLRGVVFSEFTFTEQ